MSYLFTNPLAPNRVGQEAMDRALRNFMREPRPTSVALVRQLLAVADAEQAVLIEEWTRGIVLYDLRIESAEARRRGDGRYDVMVRIAAGKIRTDGGGAERPVPLNEAIEIAVAAEGKRLDSREHPLRQGMNEIRLVVDAPPTSVTVDPGITRVDRNPLDNSKRF